MLGARLRSIQSVVSLLLAAIIVFTAIFAPPAKAGDTITWDAPEYTLGWCATAVYGQPDSVCFSSPVEACNQQYNVYGLNFGATGPVNAVPAGTFIQKCTWLRNGGPFPPNVYFQCTNDPFIAIKRVAPNRCVFEDFALKCDSNCGGTPNDFTPRPINRLTGAKRFDATDYESADGALSLSRTFVSMPYGGTDNSIFGQYLSLANWAAFFDVQVQLSNDWDYFRIVSVVHPDGTAERFQRQSDGSMTPYGTTYHPTLDKDTKLQLIGTWDSNLNHVTWYASTWALTDKYNNLWTLQTRWDPSFDLYRVARPTSVQRPDGTVLTFTYDSNNALTTITDQAGKTISLTWNMEYVDATHQVALTLAEATFPSGHKIKYTYETNAAAVTTQAATRLKKVEYLDNLGVVKDSTTYQYSNSKFPTNVTAILDHASAVRWKATYDNSGRATKSEGPNGEFADTLSYGASGANFTRTQTNALGQQSVYNYSRGSTSYYGAKLMSVDVSATTYHPSATASYSYDSSNYVETSTDFEGRVTQFTRNTNAQPTQIIEAYGTSLARTRNLTWNLYFNLPLQIAESGLKTNYGYDSQGRLTSLTQIDTTSQTVPYSTNGQSRTWTYMWGTAGSALGKLVSVDGPLSGTGDTQYFTYNTNGYLASVTDEVGKTTTISSWDWRGAPLTVVDPNSVSTTFTYDIHGRALTATINPGGSQSQYSFEYDVVGNLTKMTLPEGGYLQYTYDPVGTLTLITNNRGETITLTPNALGQATLSVTKDASATITQQQSLAYDELGRLIQTLGAASTTPTNLAYDKADNLKQITDGRGKVSNITFDALDRAITSSNPQSQTTTYGYTANDALVSHKDGRNLETTRITNGFGEVIREVSPDRGTLTYWYDNAGRVTKIIDGDSVETDFTCDNAGRLLTQTFPAATGENITYGYDSTASGNKGVTRLTSVAEQSGSTAFIYDARGRVTKDSKVIQSIPYEVAYAYDSNSLITQITLPSGRVVTFARATDGLITGITTKPTSSGSVSTIASSVTYRPFGPLKSLTYGNGLILTQSFNLNEWLTRIEVKDSGTTAFDLSYQYFDDGRLGLITDNAATGRSVTIGLSDAGRLTSANGPWGQEAYTYDAAGNRTAANLTIGGTTTTNNAITDTTSNRLLRTTDAGGTTKRTLTYRTGGDLSTDVTTGGSTYSYDYNARKRLKEVQLDSSVAAEYGYDFREQRIWRTLHGLLASATIHYIFDQNGHLVAEHEGGTGAVLREYIWLDDMPVAVIDSTTSTKTTYFIHSGHLNEPQVMTDASKAKVWDAYVSPFGSATVFTSTGPNLGLRLPGQWFQAEAAGAGLNQNHHRDYDPTLGRYIEVDPLGIGAGPNPYAYVDGQAYDAIDPEGLIVKVVSSDPAEVKMLQQAYARLNRSKHAMKMNEVLEKSKIVFKIKIMPGTNVYCNRRSNSFKTLCDSVEFQILLDPCTIPALDTLKGPQKPPLEIVLGHELGHAFGYLTNTPGQFDDGLFQMNNINAHENPIRRDLGYPARISYAPGTVVVVTGKRR